MQSKLQMSTELEESLERLKSMTDFFAGTEENHGNLEHEGDDTGTLSEPKTTKQIFKESFDRSAHQLQQIESETERDEYMKELRTTYTKLSGGQLCSGRSQGFSPGVTDILLSVFEVEQHPNKDGFRLISERTGLDIPQVRRWFKNKRYREKHNREQNDQTSGKKKIQREWI